MEIISAMLIPKKIWTPLALLFAITVMVNAQVVNIPDPNFKAYLVGNSAINTNSNSEIEMSEAASFTGAISVHGQGISDLTGIEAFINLTTLECTYNTISTFDLSANTALLSLVCNNNSLINLDLSTNVNLNYLNCASNSLNSLDVSNNTELTYLDCYGNSILDLDVSANTDLITLNCYYNSLTNLDVSTNVVLTNLKCHGNDITDLVLDGAVSLTVLFCERNSLTTLDVSANTALESLNCSSNHLTNLDVSANIALTALNCRSNYLTSLDLSANSQLVELYGYSNSFSSLNLANGNNSGIVSFWIKDNPNLFCIQVSDPDYMNANFDTTIFKDDQGFYVQNCFYNTEPNTIIGTIYQDQSANCIKGNTLSKGIIIKDQRGYFAVVDTNGNYSLKVDSGVAEVGQIFTRPFIEQACFSGQHSIGFTSLGEDTTGVDFYNNGDECPLLNVDVHSNRRRRCFRNSTYINYKNDGFEDESNVEIKVSFPENVHLISADMAYIFDEDSNYVFNIGFLAQGAEGRINIIDSVACKNGIAGLTQCTRAWITPANDCINNLDTTVLEWDKSSVKVGGSCEGDSVQFKIVNTGEFGGGDMQGISEYRIYVDNTLVHTSTFQLLGQEVLIVTLPANGQTIRLEADQRFGHPGRSRPRETVEACGNGGVPVQFRMPLQVELDNQDYEVAEHCLEIIDSYDPNDKKALPSGITSNRYVHPDSRIGYTIRFQNTGSDTAYTVIVVDTLSQQLDLTTIQLGAYSHNYEFDIRRGNNGEPVLMFTFKEINLVDSLTDEPNSNGFFSYSIKALDGTVNNTVVHNEADIYFDYNLPIITNDSWVTISDTVIQGTPIDVKERLITAVEEFEDQRLILYPNPFSEIVTVVIPTTLVGSSTVRVIDMVGREVYSISTKTNGAIQIDGTLFGNGVYVVELSNSYQVIGRSKIVKQ